LNPGRWRICSFRLVGGGALFAASYRQFPDRSGPGLVPMGLHTSWVIHSNVAFERPRSNSRTAWAEKIAAVRSGQGQRRGSRKKAARPPFCFASYWATRRGGLFGRTLISAGQYVTTRGWVHCWSGRCCRRIVLSHFSSGAGWDSESPFFVAMLLSCRSFPGRKCCARDLRRTCRSPTCSQIVPPCPVGRSCWAKCSRRRRSWPACNGSLLVFGVIFCPEQLDYTRVAAGRRGGSVALGGGHRPAVH